MISVFNYLSLDSYFAGLNGELDWFYSLPHDDEWYSYTHQQAKASSTLIFGHTTYEMMKSYWPTEEALKMDPAMANAVNNSPKIVFSKTLKDVKEEKNWKYITLHREINPDEIIKLKKKNDMIILGSGTIIQQFANLGLIDEYFLVVVPIILGSGKSFFSTLNRSVSGGKDVKRMNLILVETKSFKNGVVLLHYTTLKNNK